MTDPLLLIAFIPFGLLIVAAGVSFLGRGQVASIAQEPWVGAGAQEMRKPRNVIRPFGALIDAMQEKDERLYSEICRMPIRDAVKAWREVYPEDFADVADR